MFGFTIVKKSHINRLECQADACIAYIDKSQHTRSIVKQEVSRLQRQNREYLQVIEALEAELEGKTI